MATSGPFREERALDSKSKRRRTSPQDHATLEAAYQANSKPCKEEREKLVSQVKLGEKEVQIWFQNRRQNDRRRSKPLQPHELIAHITGTTSPTPVTPDPSQSPAVDPSPVNGETIRGHHPPTPEPALSQSPLSKDDVPSSADSREEDPPRAQGICALGTSLAAMAASPTKEDADLTVEGPLVRPQSESPASSGRKRSYCEMVRPTHSVASRAIPAPACVVLPKTKGPLKRSSSVRLAITVDGAVKIRTNDDLTPSPEKQQSLPPTSTGNGNQRKLSRSISMFGDLKSSVKAPRSSGVYGRSRDHRKWEFYCDNSADDALSIQAEAERSGSAVSAINLLRSNSLKNRGLAMSPAPSRANLQSGGHARSGKPQLSRAKSSLARLSSQPDAGHKEASKPLRHVQSPSDSDKENWAPGTRMSENTLRRTQPSTNRRPVLQVNEAVIFPDASATRAKSANNQLSLRKEKARGEDLDCIQGLLSLSQGAWR